MYVRLTFQVCTKKITSYLTNVWQRKFAQSSERLKPNLQDLRREEHSMINLFKLHWRSFKRYWQLTYWIVNLLSLFIHTYLGFRLWKCYTNAHFIGVLLCSILLFLKMIHYIIVRRQIILMCYTTRISIFYVINTFPTRGLPIEQQKDY